MRMAHRSWWSDLGWILLGLNFGLLLYERSDAWRGFAMIGLPLVAVVFFVINASKRPKLGE